MPELLRIGIIGAGTISAYHMGAYQACPDARLCAICDLNAEAAKARVQEFGIETVYSDYRELLANPDIDAVSITSPTFTHHQIVLDALAAGKHVLCEKPPALTVAQAEECVRAAQQSGKVLTYGFVARFYNHMQYLKQQVDSGAMGDIYFANLTRFERAVDFAGWFIDKDKAGGGNLIDGSIHEIDSALYLMGYPKVKRVTGYTTNLNRDLPDRVSGNVPPRNRTVEAAACGMVQFENGACLMVKSASALLTPEERFTIEVCGTKSGLTAHVFSGKLKQVALDEASQPVVTEPTVDDATNPFHRQISHFVDCCRNGTECIVKPWQAVEVMKIVCAIYESAETGREILF